MIRFFKNFKLNFTLPKKIDVMFLDGNFAKINLESQCTIHIKKKNSIYVYAAIKTILNILWKRDIFNEYFKNYIKMFNPKIIISHELDSNIFRTKKYFPAIKTIIYQFADQSDLFRKTSQKLLSLNDTLELKSDYFLVKNEYSKNFYSFVQSNFLIVGSIKNNEIYLKKTKKIYDIAFVSQYRNRIKSYYGTNNNIGSMRLIDSGSSYILKILKELAYEKKFKISVGLVSNREDKKYKITQNIKDNEINFFKRDLDSFFHEDISTYELANKSNLTITINSTIGFELLARNMKVVFFDLFNFIGGSPLDSIKENNANEGLFWFKGNEKNKIKEKILSLLELEQVSWESKLKNYNIIAFDPSNKILKNLINELLINSKC